MREQKKARFIHTGKNIATKFQQRRKSTRTENKNMFSTEYKTEEL